MHLCPDFPQVICTKINHTQSPWVCFRINRLWGQENYLVCANETVWESKISFRKEIGDSGAHTAFIRTFKNLFTVRVMGTEI